MLMQCDGKLFRVQSERGNILDTNSELFTFDHVLNQIYIYRHGQILRLQPRNKTRAVQNVRNLKDFNVVGGLITHLYNDGTICHNNTIIDKIDMANHTRLPIYVAPKHVPTTENSINSIAFFFIFALLLFTLEICLHLCIRQMRHCKIICTIHRRTTTPSPTPPPYSL